MKVELRKEGLIDLLEKATRFTPNNPVIPITGNLLISGIDGNLVVRATNLNDDFKGVIKNLMLPDFSFSVPAVILTKTVKLFKDNNIVFTINPTNIELVSGKSKYKIASNPVVDFPAERVITPMEELSLPCSNFKEIVKKSIQSCGDDDLRPAMKGIYFTLEENSLVTYATNTVTLTRTTSKVLSANKFTSIIIDKSTLNLLIGTIKDEESIDIVKGEKSVFFTIEKDELKCTVTSTLPDGKFPNAKAVIPTTYTDHLVFNTIELREIIKRLSLFCNKVTSSVAIKQEGRETCMFAEDIDFGNSGEEFFTEVGLHGKDITIAFNAISLSELIHSTEEDYIKFAYTDGKRIALFEPITAHKPDVQFLYLMMPLMLLN